MTKVTETAKAKAIEILNGMSKDLSIRKIEGKQPVYITVDANGTREDTRKKVGKSLKDAKFAIEEKLSRKSSENATFLTGKNVVIVYKNKKGGMNETTLNSSITELFPCIAYENSISGSLTEAQFYSEVQKKVKSSKVFLGSDKKAGEKFVDQAANSSKFTEKIKNAKAALKYIKEQANGKKISQVYWGYRTKPSGVSSAHPGDIFVEYADGNMLGISLKAGGAKTREPKLNTYVSKTIEVAFKDPTTYQKWQKESYDTFYTKVPNIPEFSLYGKAQMINAVADLEANDSDYYNELYDQQLEWLRDKMIEYLQKDANKTKTWLKQYVAHVGFKVPNVVVKLIQDRWEVVNDDDVVAECVERSKKGKAGLKVEKGSGKQAIVMSLICEDHPTKLDFTIRTNQAGSGHKLGQFIRLAFKFNGIIK